MVNHPDKISQPTLTVGRLDLDNTAQVAVVGEIPAGLPSLTWPSIPWHQLSPGRGNRTVMDTLRRSGFIDELGEDHVHLSMHAAVLTLTDQQTHARDPTMRTMNPLRS